MAETSYPVAGGAGVNEYTYELLQAQPMGTGRVEVAADGSVSVAALVYADSTGRLVKVAANAAYILRGYRWESGTDVLSVPLAANTSGKTRIDRIVLRLDRATYQVRLAVLQGTPADAPAVPAVTRSLLSTGYYEEPIARVTVRSQAGTNLPSIAAADVAPEHRYLSPASQYGIAAYRGTNPIGRFYTESDTGKLWMGAPGGDILVGENSPFTKVSAAGGWTTGNIYCQRVNGMTYFQAYMQVTTAKANTTDLTVCTLPAEFRSQRDFYCNVHMSPYQNGWCNFDADTGVVKITAFATTFPAGGTLIIGPVAYPSVGVKG